MKPLIFFFSESCSFSDRPVPAFRRWFVVAVTLGLILAVKTQAQVVFVSWDFAGAAGDQASSESGFVSGSFEPSFLTRGAGLTAAADADSFNSTGWTVGGTVATAVANDDYLTFTLTPGPGVTYSLTQIVVNVVIPTAASPDIFALRSSADGFAANTGGFNFNGLGGGITSEITFTLSANPLLQNLSTDVIFRLYGWSATTTASSFSLEGTGNDLIVSGTVSAVPEPGTYAMWAGVFALGLAIWRRRRAMPVAACTGPSPAIS